MSLNQVLSFIRRSYREIRPRYRAAFLNELIEVLSRWERM